MTSASAMVRVTSSARTARFPALVMVRADVQTLGAAIDTGADASTLLQSLDANIACLPAVICGRCCASLLDRSVVRSTSRDEQVEALVRNVIVHFGF